MLENSNITACATDSESYMFDRSQLTPLNHGDALLLYLHHLHQTQRFADVIIQCEGVVVDLCHRLVLAAFSRHFESALVGVDGSNQITLDIDPKVTGVNVEDLRLIFEYMYTGRVISTDTLFKTAKALGITTLTNLIIKRNCMIGSVLISDDHSNFLMHQCRRYYQENKFMDVAIHCEGIFMRNCHRVVLSAFSDHFEAALSNTENCPFVTLDIDSEITGVSSMDLRIIVDFMYQGAVRAPRSRTKQLIIAGRSLGVSKLCDIIISTDSSASPLPVAQQTIVDGVFSAPGGDYVPLNAIDLATPAAIASIVSAADPQLGFNHLIDEVGAQEDVGVHTTPGLTLQLHSQLSVDSSLTASYLHQDRYDDLTAAMATTSAYYDHASSGVAAVSMSTLTSETLSSMTHNHGAAASAVSHIQQGHSVGSVMDDLGASSSPPPSSMMSNTPLPDDATMTDDIYDEYVIGPRRRRNPMGTYRGQMKIKCVNEPKRSLKTDFYLEGLGATPQTMYIDENGLIQSSSSSTLNVAASSSTVNEFPCASSSSSIINEDEVSSVTLSLTAPLSKRRRSYYLDAYGYGLPEIIGGTDVTVPLLVGDQQLMMEKPFKCPYCDHRTKEKSALEKHVRCIHTLEAPYKCRFCNQAFKVQSNLVRHIRAHTGEKPYVCKKCGAAYADKKNMDAHVFREHLKMRPLECPTNGCSAKFWRQDRFNYHCRRQHGLEPPEEGAEMM
uniref:Uncharacterized protein n=1 Tax=Romanomermis culicivorax TaxID=13658 RepID=A0A915I2I0_ROMCU